MQKYIFFCYLLIFKAKHKFYLTFFYVLVFYLILKDVVILRLYEFTINCYFTPNSFKTASLWSNSGLANSIETPLDLSKIKSNPFLSTTFKTA